MNQRFCSFDYSLGGASYLFVHIIATLASDSPQDPANRQATIDLLEEIHLWLQSLALLLKPLGAAKGLLNYDRNSELETALKDLINVNKDLLKATYLLTAEDFPELADSKFSP